MFLVNGEKAILRQFNREENDSIYDDQNYKDIIIKACPYDVDQGIKFGIYSVPEATGYYTIPRWVDVKEGDQICLIGRDKNITFEDKCHTILKVQDSWIFNRVENKVIAIK